MNEYFAVGDDRQHRLVGKYDTKSRRCHAKHFRQLIIVQTMQPQAEAGAEAAAEAVQQCVSETL